MKDLNIYVLIKQVPDTKSKAGINPDGTIDRAKAGKMLNPFDAYALQAALNAKVMGGPNSKIIAVTMGPPPAVDILYSALEHGVDKTCILSDKKLAASDTLATAYALSKTLEYLFQKEGKADLIFCGLQTTDGDTAQVGPQIAERLDYSQVSYCEDFKIQNNLVQARRVIEGGAQELTAELPALITIANSYQKLKYKTFRGAKFVQELKRNENLKNQYMEVVDLAKVGAEDARCGLAGSPTIVSMTWKIGSVGGNCTMHQGKSTQDLVSEVVDSVDIIKEYALA
jgi:electron transfer flavoprotein beta subunit